VRFHPFVQPSVLTLQSLLVAAVAGALAGTHAAIWGMYKDSIYEGFETGTFVRSIIVGTVAAISLQIFLRLELPKPAALVVLFGLAYAAERGIVEVWKTFLRDQDQSKFFIPMAFSVRGVPVASRGARVAAGIGYVTVVGAFLGALAQLDRGAPGPPTLPKSAFAGMVVGLIIAIGGAWKDAPKERFQATKFFRSPAVTVAFALALSFLTNSHLHVAVAAIGYERAAVETYKTFLARDAPPGKFAGKPELYPEMRMRRRRAIPVFIGILVVLILTAVSAARGVSERTG
jgi:hypothetical protein